MLWTGRQDHARPDRGPSARHVGLRRLEEASRGADGRVLGRRGLSQADGTDAGPGRVRAAQLPH